MASVHISTPAGSNQESDRDQSDHNQSDHDESETTDFVINPLEQVEYTTVDNLPRHSKKLSLPKSARRQKHGRRSRTKSRTATVGTTTSDHVYELANSHASSEPEIQSNFSYGAMNYQAGNRRSSAAAEYEIPRSGNKLFAINMKRYILSTLGVPNIPGVSSQTQTMSSKHIKNMAFP